MSDDVDTLLNDLDAFDLSISNNSKTINKTNIIKQTTNNDSFNKNHSRINSSNTGNNCTSFNNNNNYNMNCTTNSNTTVNNNNINNFNSNNSNYNNNSIKTTTNHLLPKPPVGNKSHDKYTNPKLKASIISTSNNINSNHHTAHKSHTHSHLDEDLSIDDLLEVLDDTTGDSPQPCRNHNNNKNNNSNSNSGIGIGIGIGANSGMYQSSFDNNNRNSPKSFSSNTLSSMNNNNINNNKTTNPSVLGSFSNSTGNINNNTVTKCSRVVLSGNPYYQWGVKASSFAKVACDRLRCMSCNFQVLIFKDCSWKTDPTLVDYMFFRNNMPNKNKLMKGIINHHTMKNISNNTNITNNNNNNNNYDIGYDIDFDDDILQGGLNSINRSNTNNSNNTNRPNSGIGSNHSDSSFGSSYSSNMNSHVPSGTAYCCQCSWVTINQNEIDLNQVVGNVEGIPGSLKWICGSH